MKHREDKKHENPLRQRCRRYSLCCVSRTGAVRDTKTQAFLWQHTIKNGSDTQCSSSTPAPWAFFSSSASWDEAMSHTWCLVQPCHYSTPYPTWHHLPGAPKQRDSCFPPASSKVLLKFLTIFPWQDSSSFQACFCTWVLYCFTYLWTWIRRA